MQPKKTYDSPKVTFYGNVEQITFGSHRGLSDGVFGAPGADGSPFPNECQHFPQNCGS